MANNQQVATLSCKKFMEFLGPDLVVMRSERDGAKYPLYLSTRMGPVHLNTPRAQDFVLENGLFKGAEESTAVENIAADNAVVNDAGPVEKPKRRGVLDRFLTLDE